MLRDAESFSMSGNIADYGTYNRFYSPAQTNCYISNGGPFGDRYFHISGAWGGNISINRRIIPGGPFNTLGHSCRMIVGTGFSSQIGAVDLVNNVTHCYVTFNGTTGSIQIGNSSGVLFTSGLGQFPIGAWFWVEVLFTIGSGTSGAVKVKLPGTTINLTGINTQNGSRALMDTTQHTALGEGFHGLAHMLWWDTTGSYNNGWLGDQRVFGALATANGDTDNFTPNGLASNYLNVANAPPNAADYNASGTVGAVDLYKGSSPAGVTGVAGVMVSAIAEKDDSGTRSLATQIKSGGATATGSSVVLASSYTTQSDVYEVDPSTSVPFVPSALPNLQFGATVTA